MTPFTLHQEGSQLNLALSGDVTIQHAAELASALKDALQPGHILAVDAGNLTRLDASTLQILLACAQTASDTLLEKSSPAWVTCFTRYASSDPFRPV